MDLKELKDSIVDDWESLAQTLAPGSIPGWLCNQHLDISEFVTEFSNAFKDRSTVLRPGFPERGITVMTHGIRKWDGERHCSVFERTEPVIQTILPGDRFLTGPGVTSAIQFESESGVLIKFGGPFMTCVLTPQDWPKAAKEKDVSV